jgi:cystathionine beta-lyase
MDNTWASPLYFRPLDKGVDLAIQSASKYIGGHSDLVMGVVAAGKAVWPKLREMTFAMGLCVAPDDAYLGLRGFRTLSVRLARHYQSGIAVARWLEQRPEVLRVIHPALPSHPGHALWNRDFSGACGLFAIVLEPVPERAVHAFLDALTLHGKGVSWGGCESLAIPFDLGLERTATRWQPGGPCLRLHVGLEDVRDLIADLERGFAALAAAR